MAQGKLTDFSGGVTHTLASSQFAQGGVVVFKERKYIPKRAPLSNTDTAVAVMVGARTIVIQTVE